MALGQTITWDVRTTGNDANGGGFFVNSTGTDYSQQNSPQFAYTDLVIASTTTNVTSALNPFTAATVGNIINITGGTGFTTGRYQVISVSGVTATLDRAVGTAASTGGTGNLGGCFLTPAAALSAATGGGDSVIYIKSGTYTITTGLSTNNASVTLQGYGTTHGDTGTATIATSTNSINMLSWSGGGMSYFGVKNLVFSCTASTPGIGINQASSNSCVAYFTNCTVSGCSYGFYIFGGSSNPLCLTRCHVYSCTTGAIRHYSGTMTCSYCYFHNNGYGWLMNGPGIAVGCVFYANTGNAIYPANGMVIANCALVSNGGDGITNLGPPTAAFVSNSIFYGNGGYGINDNSLGGYVFPAGACFNNAFGANTSGNFRSGYFADGTDVILTANPFTAPASGNFTLNSTAGGGAACKALGFPGLIIGTTGTGALDIGPLQSASSGGGSSVSNYGFTS